MPDPLQARPTATVDLLRLARDIYSQAPSHAHPDKAPTVGTYCVLMATEEARKQLGLPRYVETRADQALRRVVGGPLMDFNYESSTARVLSVFDAALAAEGEKARV